MVRFVHNLGCHALIDQVIGLLYQLQQKYMLGVQLGISLSRLFVQHRATTPEVLSLWKDQRRAMYVASSTTAVAGQEQCLHLSLLSG